MPSGRISEATPEIVRARHANPTYSYYTKEHAEWITPVIERMIKDRRPTKFEVVKFGKSVDTLEKMVNRSINYLVDNMDTPDKRYAKFKKETKVRREAKDGYAMLEFKLLQPEANPAPDQTYNPPVIRNTDTGETKTLVASPEGDIGATNINWQDAIDNFINGSYEVGKELIITGLDLDYESICGVKASVIGVSEIELVSVDREKIVLRRVS